MMEIDEFFSSPNGLNTQSRCRKNDSPNGMLLVFILLLLMFAGGTIITVVRLSENQSLASSKSPP